MPPEKIRERKAWYNLSRDWGHRLWSISLAWALFDLHPRILNMQTCLPAISTTPKLPASTAGKGCSEGTSAGAGLCQKLHACLPPSFTVSCRGCGCWVRPRSIKSCLPPVYLWHHSRDNLYQAFLSLIFFLGKGSRKAWGRGYFYRDRLSSPNLMRGGAKTWPLTLCT